MKFKVGKVKICVDLVYGPYEGKNKRERFRNDLGTVSDRVGSGYALYVMGGVNKRIEDRESENITCVYGVVGGNKNRKRTVCLCVYVCVCVCMYVCMYGLLEFTGTGKYLPVFCYIPKLSS